MKISKVSKDDVVVVKESQTFIISAENCDECFCCFPRADGSFYMDFYMSGDSDAARKTCMENGFGLGNEIVEVNLSKIKSGEIKLVAENDEYGLGLCVELVQENGKNIMEISAIDIVDWKKESEPEVYPER